MTPEKALESLQKQIWSKDQWLRTFSSKRPKHDVEIKQEEREALQLVAGWFERGLAKRNAA